MSPFASLRIRFRVEEEEAATLVVVVVVVIYRNQIESYLILLTLKDYNFKVSNLRNPETKSVKRSFQIEELKTGMGEKMETLKL